MTSPIPTPACCACPGRALARVGVIGLLTLSACDRRPPAWRTYREQTINAPAPSAAMSASATDTAPASTLRWDRPDGWAEERGTGMRLASFTVSAGGRSGLCTIVELGGDAGGLEANIRRWLGQLKLPVPESGAWEDFIQRQTPLSSTGGLSGMIVDLTTLGAGTEDTPSMLAAMFSEAGATVFVKITGPIALLRAEQGRFESLCRSLRRGN